MTSTDARTTVSRRTALAGLSAGGLGLALATHGRSAVAQDASAAPMAGHPLVGTWMAMTPFGASPETLSADGSFVAGPPIIEPAADGGVQYLGPAIGVWESTGDRTGSFTFVQALGDATGAYTGTLTIDGHLEASEDGQSFVDDSPETTITIRDTANAVLQVIHPYEPGSSTPPVTAIRMAVGQPGFPESTATPTP
jgi:hypothetical protein